MRPPMACRSEPRENSCQPRLTGSPTGTMPRRPRLLSLACGVGLLLASCAPAASPSSPPASAQAPAKPSASAPASAQASTAAGGAIKLAYVAPGTSFFWEWLAYNKGLFQKYGVDVKEPVLVPGTPRLGQSLVGGSFDMAGVGLQAAIEANTGGAHLEAVASQSKYSTMTITVPPGSPIQNLSQLKGKVIGLSQIGDSADSFLGFVLAKNGISRSEVTVISTGSHANTLTQLLAHKIDVGSIASNYAIIGAKQGTKTLVAARDIDALEPNGSVLVNKGWADAHRPIVLNVLKAMLAGNAMYKASQDGAVKLMQESSWFKDVDPDLLGAIWQDDMRALSDVPLVDDAAVKAAIANEADRNPAVKGLDSTTLYDNSFLNELLQSGFLKTLGA
jgi:ABC-type nitrate/sulfonate/bicarbonate transport system substrate-binding protein